MRRDYGWKLGIYTEVGNRWIGIASYTLCPKENEAMVCVFAGQTKNGRAVARKKFLAIAA